MDSSRKSWPIERNCMTLVASLTVVFVASLIGTWINDHTGIGGEYLTDEDLNAQS